MLAVAESLLLEEEIPYLKRGDQTQAGLNMTVAPVLLQVPEEHAGKALKILADLTSGELPAPSPLRGS